MKKVILFISISLSSAWASSYVVPKDAKCRITARVLDTYHSVEGEKYNLEKINTDLQIMVVSERNSFSRVVHNRKREDKIQKFQRLLTVFPNNAVLFERSPTIKPDARSMFDKNSPLFQDPDDASLKEVVVRSNLSEDEENLSVYFKEDKNKDVLLGMLDLYNVVLPLYSIQQQISSSDYECKIQYGKFLCNIVYVFTTNLKELLDNMHESEELHQKLLQPFS